MAVFTEEKVTIDLQKAEQFAGQFIVDLAANYSGVMTFLGVELGLYRAMRGRGAMTAAGLARESGVFERYLREWLNNQAAGGYIVYNPKDRTYELPEEHALVLTEEDSPFLLAPAYFVVSSMWKDKEKLLEAFKSGYGIGWHEHHHHLFHGVEAVYRTGYVANLNTTWIPSLNGVVEKLQNGGRVADIGCGHGASTILMAEQFPNAVFIGYDYHSESIDIAKLRAKEKGLSNVFFYKANAQEYQDGEFDLMCFFDCLHDFGSPTKALEYAKGKLAVDGTLLIVEPNAGDNPEENFNPIGRMFYAASTALCVPHAHSESGEHCLGAQAGPAIVEQIVKDAGYSQFRIAQQTPINLIYEVKG